MEVTVGFGRKARDNAPAILAGAIVVGDDGAQEIRRERRCRMSRRTGCPLRVRGLHCAHHLAFLAPVGVGVCVAPFIAFCS